MTADHLERRGITRVEDVRRITATPAYAEARAQWLDGELGDLHHLLDRAIRESQVAMI